MAPLAYSVSDAVKVSGIGRTTLFAEIRAGRLPAKKLGARTIVIADDLAAYLAALPSACRSQGTQPGTDWGYQRRPTTSVG